VFITPIWRDIIIIIIIIRIIRIRIIGDIRADIKGR